MKTIVFLLTLTGCMTVSIMPRGQQPFTDNMNYTLTFDDSVGLQHLWIDTISNPVNIWQVGHPQKNLFGEAYSFPNAIVTDTVKPYPPNDSSVFVIKNVIGGVISNLTLTGKYYSNTDSLHDYGKIEFSLDNGSTWTDLLNDSTLIDTINGEIIHGFLNYLNIEKPVLTGSSNGWANFGIDIWFQGDLYGIYRDTVLYRFTFVSDSIQTNKDGLMFDDLGFYGLVEGIEEKGFAPIGSYCFPNPARDRLTIRFENKTRTTFELKVFDISGQVIKELNTNSNQVVLPVQNFESGLYFYKLVDQKNKRISTGKFVNK